SRSAHHRDLPSLPTRRSSDLRIKKPSDGSSPSPFHKSKAEPEGSALQYFQRSAPVVQFLLGNLHALAHLAQEGFLGGMDTRIQRSEEHTSELQSRENLVCRLL